MIQLIGIENSAFRSISAHLLALTEHKKKIFKLKKLWK